MTRRGREFEREFESTWVWVRNNTDRPRCKATRGQPCVSRFGRAMTQLHMDRKFAPFSS